MKQNVPITQDNRRYYLSEFAYYDGDHYITFNIVDIDALKNEISVAVSNEGRISVVTFDLRTDAEDCLYFEYGASYTKIAVDDFEYVED